MGDSRRIYLRQVAKRLCCPPEERTRLLTERSWERAVGYAIVANVCSATVGLLLIDPLWKFIVSIS